MTIAKPGTEKYIAQVWAGILEDDAVLAQERARRERERARRERLYHPETWPEVTPEGAR